jgi:hypothetical protein
MTRVKIIITDQDGDTESVWATHLGGPEYQIDNIPFFTYNISHRDVVESDVRDGSLHFVRILKKSGHQTVRADFESAGGIVGQPCKQFRLYLNQIGCAAEGFAPDLLAIDIPPGIEPEQVIVELERLGVDWEHGDPQPQA